MPHHFTKPFLYLLSDNSARMKQKRLPLKSEIALSTIALLGRFQGKKLWNIQYSHIKNFQCPKPLAGVKLKTPNMRFPAVSNYPLQLSRRTEIQYSMWLYLNMCSTRLTSCKHFVSVEKNVVRFVS